MNTLFLEHINNLYKDVPSWIYEGLLSVFSLGAVLMLAFYGLKKGGRYTMWLLLVEYVILIFCSTVLFRTTSESQGYNYHPFWSYAAIEEGREELIPENVMNVVVFVPVGVLLGFMINGSRFMVRHGWLIVLIAGMGISVSIETLQFFLKRGFAEVDDVMHNTTGCILGYILIQGSRFMVKGYNKIHG